MDNKLFSWIPFYEELADKLLDYKSNRQLLVEKVRQAHQIASVELPTIEHDNTNIPDMDPFTVFALFNRGKLGPDKRKAICTGYKQVFEISNAIPSDFEGVPTLTFSRYCFYPYLNSTKREDYSFNQIWEFYTEALNYDINSSVESKKKFVSLFDGIIGFPEIGFSKITIALFQIRPNNYISIDKNTKPLIAKTLNIPEIKKELSGEQYLSLCCKIKDYLNTHEKISFPEFSSKSYGVKQSKADDTTDGWFPLLSEYTPKLTKADWLRFMNESGKFNDNYKHLLAVMNDIGGQATCVQMEQKHGKTAASYNLTATNFAMAVQAFTNCECWIDEKGEKNYWSIPFIGRKTRKSEDGKFVWKLRPELKEAIDEYGLSDYLNKSNLPKKGMTAMIPKNIILYGPPGTGKTYNTAIYAVAIIEGEDLDTIKTEDYADVIDRYNNYKEQGLIEFTTFHQSYGYEEFIEGIRPAMDEDSDEDGDVDYKITPGIFKAFCETASRPVLTKNADLGLNANPVIWKVSLEGTGDNPTRTECMENNHIRIGWDSYGGVINGEVELKEGKNVLNAFLSRMKIGDIVFSCYSATTIDAIGVITGEYEWHDEYDEYKRLRNVKWLVKGIREDITSINAGKTMTLSTIYALNNITLTDVMEILGRLAPASIKQADKPKNHVFIIDEINRGNISKIFGELITLIEPSKRLGQVEGMTAKLPYSQKPFGVPDNVYLLGTMNTADRSIATLDTALRRRFCFKEMQPDPSVLDGISVEGLSISTLLANLNKKISVLYDREHTIGHAYFLPLKTDPSLFSLATIFENSILPLLQEYFYEDYEKIRLVLGDNNKGEETDQFIVARTNYSSDLFGDINAELDDSITYEINSAAFWNIASYKSI